VISGGAPAWWAREQRRDPFGDRAMPLRSLRFEGLAANEPVDFRFDSLKGEQRHLVDEACFAEGERRRGENARLSACRKNARTAAQRELETAQDDARRQWCDATRESRREQLISRFLSDVRRARNGGHGLVTALSETLAGNGQAVVPIQHGATQTCHDVHFAIDIQLLRSAFARAIGPGATDEAVSRRIAALLDEGITLRSSDFRFAVPMPERDNARWEQVLAAAEASCKAR
jgi:hypothetical protein